MSLYTFSVGQAKSALNSLENLMKIAAASPKAAELPKTNLADDMLPLRFQVQVVTDTAAKMVQRLTGQEATGFVFDREAGLTTFDQIFKQIDEAKAIVNGADEAAINAGATKTVTVGMGPGKNFDMEGQQYVLGYSIPNIYFHLTTAYGILRKEGIVSQKQDYLGSFIGQYLGTPHA